jgi:hypothetical protein
MLLHVRFCEKSGEISKERGSEGGGIGKTLDLMSSGFHEFEERVARAITEVDN